MVVGRFEGWVDASLRPLSLDTRGYTSLLFRWLVDCLPGWLFVCSFHLLASLVLRRVAFRCVSSRHGEDSRLLLMRH